jgi:hypothetical protein
MLRAFRSQVRTSGASQHFAVIPGKKAALVIYGLRFPNLYPT